MRYKVFATLLIDAESEEGLFDKMITLNEEFEDWTFEEVKE